MVTNQRGGAADTAKVSARQQAPESVLGKRIQRVRKAAKLTQQDLCQKADLSYSTLAKIERGAIKSPSVFTIQGIARALDITLDELLAPVTSGKAAANQKRTSRDGVKFVYFDVNGCLVHSFQRAFDELARETGVPKDIIQATYIHYDDQVCKGAMTLEQFNEALARQLHKVNINWADYYLRAVEPVAGMIDTVNAVAAEYHVGLLTNTMPTLVSAMREKGLIPNVAYDSVVESCVVKAMKPDADIFAIAVEQSGFAANEILLIDDTRTNLAEAEKHGWHTLWFDDYFPDQSIQTIKSLLEVN